MYPECSHLLSSAKESAMSLMFKTWFVQSLFLYLRITSGAEVPIPSTLSSRILVVSLIPLM